MRARALLVALACLCGIACRGEAPGPTAEAPRPEDSGKRLLASLRRYEAERRSAVRFLEQPPPEGRFGADPYALARLPDGTIAGVLRGADELVLLDRELRVRARSAAPAGAIGVSAARGHLFVVGERASELWVYRTEPELSLVRTVPIDLYAARALAASADRLFVVEQESGRLLTLSVSAVLGGAPDPIESEQVLCEGPTGLVLASPALTVACLWEHQLVVLEVTDGGVRERARIAHDGPFWGHDLSWQEGALWIAAVGVEDHPLDRTIGSFGYVDSFLYLYRLDWAGTDPPRRVVAENVSEHGLVVPKVVKFLGAEGASPRLLVSAYGSDRGLEFELGSSAEPASPPRAFELLPGTTAAVEVDGALVFANPLVDAWVRLDAGGVQLAREARAESEAVRLGEVLVFTQLLAPRNQATGPYSRFTCETCHFEGGVDGRTHHTGRADVRATTKPLYGLFNNRPHFSRALDEDLSKVVHAEFRVAGANSGHDPVFDVRQADFPWLGEFGLDEALYDPLALRRAVMEFLIEFTPPSNPRVRGRRQYSPEERRGAELFRDRCEACHAARASADDPDSRQAFESWEALVFDPSGPLVWGSAGYQRTGVLPYVHAQGARTPSLRRLLRKRPYFTNGTAPDLSALLGWVRLNPFSHQGGTGTPMTEAERVALLAFLQLL